MKALVKEKKGRGYVKLVEMPAPEISPREIKIAVRAAGICGTDIHIAHDTFPYSPPVILGHEFSGDVSEVGREVENLKVGDRVMAETTAVLCGQCLFCRNGQTNLCLGRKAYGIHVNGGFAEFVVVRKEAVHRLPPNVDYISGAMTEPLAVCVHALTERIRISTGQLVLVLGPGPVGLLAAILAKAHGARVVLAGTAQDQHRLQLAKNMGVDLAIQVDDPGFLEQLNGLSKGKGGVDITVEAAGVARSVETAYKHTRKGGTIVQLGLFEGPILVDYSQLVFREFNIIGAFAHCWSSFETALELMDRNIINVKPLVSTVLPLDRWEEAFRRVEHCEGVKVMLAPGNSPE